MSPTPDRPAKPPSLGDRREPLGVDRIVRAAVELADTRGLSGVSMRNLAEELSATPMALYRHVESREQLLELMYDEVVGSSTPVPIHSGAWKTDLRAVADDIRSLILKHPWAASLMTGGNPSLGPNATQRLEWAFEAVSGLGLPIESMTQIVLAVIRTAHAAAQDETSRPTRESRMRTRSLLSDPEFPLVARMLEQLTSRSSDTFEVHVTLVLTGIERIYLATPKASNPL